jgi:hypothetical protein
MFGIVDLHKDFIRRLAMTCWRYAPFQWALIWHDSGQNPIGQAIASDIRAAVYPAEWKREIDDLLLQ